MDCNTVTEGQAELWVCGDWRVGHDTRADGKQAAVSMERPSARVCPEMTLVRTFVWSMSSPAFGSPEWSAAKDFAMLMLLAGGDRLAAQDLWLRKVRIHLEAPQGAGASAPKAA